VKLKKSEIPVSTSPAVQYDILNQPINGFGLPRFEDMMSTIGKYPLKPSSIEILQLNFGYMCNLQCDHCHVNAAPDRKEVMTRKTMIYCLEALKNSEISTVDLTGGAPEMNPHFRWFIEEVSKLNKKVIVRSNLTILVANNEFKKLPEFLAEHKVCIIASLPCYTLENTDYQRGKGVFTKSIEAMRLLNQLGYAKSGTDLELHIVYNPIGAHLPPDQSQLEQVYKRELKEHFDIEFDQLYNITNMPVGRYLDQLLNSKKYEPYMEDLIEAFNPIAAEGVMCRNTISVGWDGILYDCDFNQMLKLKIKKESANHIKNFDLSTLQKRDIVLNQHCFGCTAGAGSSCQGSIA